MRPFVVAVALPLLCGPLSAQRASRHPAARTALPPAVIVQTSPDSLRADSAAFDALPERLRDVLDVRSRINPASADPNVVCVRLSTTSDGSRRQRLQGRLGDATSLVVFARVSARGALGRVEFVRRLANGEQRGFTWDAAGDATTGMDWAVGSTVSTSYPIPRGSPIPRALRGLGRIVAGWSCA
jgi:hypothetical protein